MNPTTLLSGLGAAITADPALGGASSAGRDSSGGGDLFLSLVAGLLQGDSQSGPGATPGPATATPETPAESTDPATGLPVLTTPDTAVVPAAPDETDPAAEVPAAGGTEVTVLPITLAVPPLVAQATALAAPVPSRPEAVATTATSVDGAEPAPPVGTPPAPAAPGQAGTEGDPGGSGEPGDQGAVSSPAPASADVDAAPAAGSSGPRVDARADAVPTQATGVPGAVAVAPTAAPAAVATPVASAELPRVADQVFPEVLRATTNAENGTSRVTVKLNPESLGEVRVVLTQRGGTLEVTLAAGADARRALTDGASELHRLLESVGRPDSRVLIRDLPNGPLAPVTPNAPSVRTDVSTDLAGGPWSGAGSPGGEPAPDREQSRHHPGSSTATDGIPSATLGSRPTTTASRGHVGLDLSM